jgi:hypothetical protein
VTIASAVCASSCVPGLIEPVHLEETLADGSLRVRCRARARRGWGRLRACIKVVVYFVARVISLD